MTKLMGVIFVFLSMMGAAYGDVQVSCNEDNCLTNGWVVFNNGFITGEVECVDNDCRHNGWDVLSYVGDAHLSIRCHSGDCFEYGWDEELLNGYLIRQIFCSQSTSGSDQRDVLSRPSCFTNGWRIREKHKSFRIQCLQSDCTRFGWIFRGSGVRRRMSCRLGSCFTKGWNNW